MWHLFTEFSKNFSPGIKVFLFYTVSTYGLYNSISIKISASVVAYVSGLINIQSAQTILDIIAKIEQMQILQCVLV